MLKTKLIIVFLLFAFSTNIYPANPEKRISKQDSIYLDLSRFLIKQGLMNKEIENEGKKYIEVFELISKSDTLDFVNIPFGVFKFRSMACEDCGYFVLIKHNSKFKVIEQSNVGLIIRLLLEIKDVNPGLMNNELFEAYVRALSDTKQGLGGERMNVLQKFGNLNYLYDTI